AAAQRAASQLKQGKAGPPRPAGPGVLYVQLQTPLEAADAKNRTAAMRRAIGSVPGTRTYLTGFPALAHDEQPIYSRDLSRGEELSRGQPPDGALQTSMMTAGRATLVSGMTVAIGLAALLLMPLPFIRSMGAGGVLIPLVSMAASATLLPALLSLLGARVNR